VTRTAERLDNLKDLAKYEEEILDAIGVTPHGALLFFPIRAASSTKRVSSWVRVCRPSLMACRG
jgi:hypothetical protein